LEEGIDFPRAISPAPYCRGIHLEDPSDTGDDPRLSPNSLLENVKRWLLDATTGRIQSHPSISLRTKSANQTQAGRRFSKKTRFSARASGQNET
jgi:hypothetical protein